MTARIIRKQQRLASEAVNSMSRPPQSRSNMMMVAGDVDDEDDVNNLLFDDETEIEHNEVVVITLSALRQIIAEVIRKTGKGYTLYTKHGKKRKLNKKPKSLKAVKAQERAIHANGR